MIINKRNVHMNLKYIDQLIRKKKTGLLIHLIKKNVNVWSLNVFQHIFNNCTIQKLYNVFFFMMEHFHKRDCISFYDNERYAQKDIKRIMLVINSYHISKYLMIKHNVYDIYSTCLFNCPCIMKYERSEIVSKIHSPDKDYYDALCFYISNTRAVSNSGHCSKLYKIRYLTSDVNIHLYLENDHYDHMYHIKYVLTLSNMHKISDYMHNTMTI